MCAIGGKAIRLLALLISCVASISFAAEKKNILVLYSFHEGLPWSDSFREGLVEARKKYPDFAYFQEYMDEQRLSPSMSDEDWIDYLNRKYRSIRFAGIIAESSKAGIFVNDHRDRLPRVPAAIYSDMILSKNPETLYMSSDEAEAIDGTIEMALKQNPARNEIVVVVGGREADTVVVERLRSKSSILGFEFEVVEGFSFEELPDIARSWTGKEIVFYTLVFSDRTGRRVVPKDLLAKICSVSRAPVYAFWSPLMGAGTVGGVMVDGARIAEELALHDPLTGLLNRRALLRVITYEIHRFQRTGSPVSLIFADIDHFKDVNDRFGHDKGDDVLKAVAKLFSSDCRKTDLIARWGGEEFLILCSDTTEGHAAVLGEKLRAGAENLRLEGLPRVTLSFGIGELKGDESFDLWFSNVDHALYRAKAGGRNRVCLESSMTDWTSPLA